MNRQYNLVLLNLDKKVSGEAIAKEIHRNKLYHAEVVEDVATAQALLHSGHFQCLLINLDRLTAQTALNIIEIRRSGATVSIIIFSEHTDKDALEKIKNFRRVVAIEKPFTPRDMWGILLKFLQGRPVYQRFFRRYNLVQSTHVEKTMTGEEYSGQITNLSRGGASLEIKGGKVQPGDVLRLTIKRPESSQTFKINAEVVWSENDGKEAEIKKAGLRFMNNGDLYRTLLQHL
jgi:hypothetical protein